MRSRTRFSEIVGAGGREPRGQLIDASEESASRELARELGLKAGAPLIRIEALRFADRTPICIGTHWLSADRFPEAGRVYAGSRDIDKAKEAAKQIAAKDGVVVTDVHLIAGGTYIQVSVAKKASIRVE